MNRLEAQFNQEGKLKQTESSFRKHKKRIGRFIDRQKRYRAEREKELKDIIDLLARAMVTLDTDKTLIDRADQVLYIAKRTGKNRVVSENELTSAISVDANDKFGLSAYFAAAGPYTMSSSGGSDAIITIKYG